MNIVRVQMSVVRGIGNWPRATDNGRFYLL
jgi:hypothetical protein